jgi:protein-tyrosine phosphatase
MRPALYVISAPGPGRLATMASPRGGDWLADELATLARAEVDVLVSALTPDERERLALTSVAGAAATAGVEFVAFPIPDRGVPDERALVSLAIRLAAHVRAGRFVAVHCFAGIGRSSLIAGATLVMLGVAAPEAFGRVAAARGLPVPDTEAQRQWLYTFADRHGGAPGRSGGRA